MTAGTGRSRRRNEHASGPRPIPEGRSINEPAERAAPPFSRSRLSKFIAIISPNVVCIATPAPAADELLSKCALEHDFEDEGMIAGLNLRCCHDQSFFGELPFDWLVASEHFNRS